MNQLHDGPTKAEELEHWREFLTTLPPTSYLAMYLNGSAELLESAMRNDESTELVSALRRGRFDAIAAEAEARAACQKARQERDELQRQVDAWRRTLCNMRDEMRAQADAAQAIARDTAKRHRELAHTIAFTSRKP